MSEWIKGAPWPPLSADPSAWVDGAPGSAIGVGGGASIVSGIATSAGVSATNAVGSGAGIINTVATAVGIGSSSVVGFAAPPLPTAITITALPYTHNITSADIAAGESHLAFMGALYEAVWFKYTPPVDMMVGESTFSSNFNWVYHQVFRADPTYLVPANGTFNVLNGGSKVFTALAGETYYIAVTGDGVGSADIIVDSKPINAPIPYGAVIINDDTAGYGGVALDPLTGEIFTYLDKMPAGETGTTLPNGYALIHDISDYYTVVMLDRMYNVVGTFDLGYTQYRPQFANNGSDSFYVTRYGNPTGTYLSRININGTFDLDEWTLPTDAQFTSAYGLGVSPDGSILYYTTTYYGAAKLMRYDLVNNVPLSSIYTFDAGEDNVLVTPNGHPGDMLVMSDGTIVLWSTNNTTDIQTLWHFSPAGAVLHSYTHDITTTKAFDHITVSPNNPNSIYAWSYLGGGQALLEEITLATGVAVSSSTFTMVSAGVLSGSGALDETIFHPSASCFMGVATHSASEVPPPDLTTLPDDNMPVCCAETTGTTTPPAAPPDDNPMVPASLYDCIGGGLGPTGTTPGPGEIWLY